MRRLAKVVVAAIAAASLGFAAPERAGAETFRYTDEHGRLHIVDEIHKVPERYRRQARENQDKKKPSGGSLNLGVVATPPPVVKRPSATPEQAVARVEVYVTSWCGYCEKLEAFLVQNRIRYHRYDIEQDADARRAWKELGGSGIPLVRVGSQVIRGFDLPRLAAALRR